MCKQVEYVEFIRSCFNHKKRQGNVEEKWNELKEAIVGSAEQHLQRRRKAQKGGSYRT